MGSYVNEIFHIKYIFTELKLESLIKNTRKIFIMVYKDFTIGGLMSIRWLEKEYNLPYIRLLTF